VPKEPKPSHWLVPLIGMDNFQKLVWRAKGAKFLINGGCAEKRKQRNAAIYQDWLAGSTVPKLCSQYNLAPSSLYRILARQKQIPIQGTETWA
jgi:Mor family transcriptional regulator